MCSPFFAVLLAVVRRTGRHPQDCQNPNTPEMLQLLYFFVFLTTLGIMRYDALGSSRFLHDEIDVTELQHVLGL